MFNAKKAIEKLNECSDIDDTHCNNVVCRYELREILEAGMEDTAEMPHGGEQFREWISKNIRTQNRRMNDAEHVIKVLSDRVTALEDRYYALIPKQYDKPETIIIRRDVAEKWMEDWMSNLQDEHSDKIMFEELKSSLNKG